jgi:REP-associated tyrosine transposase
MTQEPTTHNRHSIRLQGFDYSRAGAYFVTICVRDRQCLLGDAVDGAIQLNDAGRMIQTIWDELPLRFTGLKLADFVVMPNHIHGIFVLPGRGESCIRPSPTNSQEPADCRINHESGDHKDRPYGTLPGSVGRIVQAFKSITTHAYADGVKQNGWSPFPGKLWQRNYWDHVVRNESEFHCISEYIRNNPAQWDSDQLNSAGTAHPSPPNHNHMPSSEYDKGSWSI